MSDGDGQRKNARRFFSVAPGTKPAQCRGETCQKSIFFITHPATNRPHPIDCDVPGGEMPSAWKDPRQTSVFDVDEPERHGRGVSHFETCPDALKFRRGVAD